MAQLDGKVAVITGATAGIGLAIAKRFVAEGAYVFVTGRRQSALDAAIAEIGRIGRPEEVASAALFLASGESSFIAGVELVVDGGMSQT